jgi:hypothetical protein
MRLPAHLVYPKTTAGWAFPLVRDAKGGSRRAGSLEKGIAPPRGGASRFFGHSKRAPPCQPLRTPARAAVTASGRVPRLCKQCRFQDDVVGGYFTHAESAGNVLAVNESEQVEGCFVVERGSRITVDVGHHQVDVALCETVEGRSLRKDIANELVVAFHMAFLPGGARVAVEDACRAQTALVALDGGRVGELGAVVGEQNGEKRGEELRARYPPEHVKDVDDGLRVVPVAEEREHETEAHEHEREQHFTPLAAYDRVHFDGAGLRGGRHERLEIGKGPPDAALLVDLVLDRLAGSRLEHADAGHVAVLRAEQTSGDVAVNGFFMEIKAVGVVHKDVVNRLPSFHQRADQSIEREQFAFGDVGPAARPGKLRAIIGLRRVVQVVLFAQDAFRLIPASVADVRRRRQFQTRLFQKVGACRIAVSAGGAALGAVRLVDAELPSQAVLARDAAVGDPPDGAFAAFHTPV